MNRFGLLRAAFRPCALCHSEYTVQNGEPTCGHGGRKLRPGHSSYVLPPAVPPQVLHQQQKFIYSKEEGDDLIGKKEMGSPYQ